jgi:ribonuclease HII
MAKVTRDRIMIAASDDYPPYDFCKNKGYPAPRHLVALAGYGPSAIHRRSWSYMNNMVWSSENRT